jgi:hypothetical protein
MVMGRERRTIEIGIDVHRAIERARVALGESEDDILRRLFRAGRIRTSRPSGPTGAPGPPGPSRGRGLWSLEIGGRRIPAANAKQAYRLLLRELAAAHPHFLEAFAEERGRSRRFVARSPAGLYDKSAHLARHAEPLIDGWYFDSNLSGARIARLARIAARLCGLHYGSDVRILDTLREI